MPVEVRVPTLGESVSEGVITRWLKADGDAVSTDEPLLELETDKANVEIPAETAGVLRIVRQAGDTVHVGDIVARIEAAPSGPSVSGKRTPAAAPEPTSPAMSAAPEPVSTGEPVLSPAVRRLVQEHALDPEAIQGTGRGGRLTKGDVLAHLETQPGSDEAPAAARTSAAPPAPSPPAPPPARPQLAIAPRPAPAAAGADVERVPMTRLRQRIAERLVQAQQSTATLTTFNEIDLQAVMELRRRHKARFAEVHGVTLGFMSFFARACTAALRELPIVNAHIDGTDVLYHKHVHLGVAVSTERGLVVPVVHNADEMSFAEIEKEIGRLAERAHQNKLSIDDLSGGTFTISNGGVFGSLLSTPILNPPQSAILGMHKIEKRPVVVNDEIAVRPLMYVALSYDHRLIDGEQAVTFLVRVKERIEDPARLMLDV
jgi:2-oxoglutarate dehydrogenase E2 component (dihydrolipoamide succinyltransferase)